MLKLRAISNIVGCLAIIFSTVASASFDPELSLNSVRPFAGVDFQGRHMDFDQNLGGNLFPHNYPQYDVYIGLRFLRYFGLSLGFEDSRTEDRTARFLEGDPFLGVVLPTGNGRETHYSEAKIKGRHLDLLGFYPICPNLDIDVFASIGLVRNTLTLTDILIAIDDILLDEPIVRTYDNRHTHARASLGIQKTFCDHVGIRGLVAWENTSRFEHLKPLENPAAITNVNVDNSFIYGVGVFVIL